MKTEFAKRIAQLSRQLAKKYKTEKQARLTKCETLAVDRWVSALEMGLWHDGKNIVLLGAANLHIRDTVKYVEEKDEFSYALYAISGNCSLRLRWKGLNGNVV